MLYNSLDLKNIILGDNRRCFACGPDNPIGLHLEFVHVDGRIAADFTPSAYHQGYAGITHGGILATILDEAMARMLWDNGTPVMTASFDMRLKKPAPTDQQLRVTAWVKSSRGRIYHCEAQICGVDGGIKAEARAVYIHMPGHGD